MKNKIAKGQTAAYFSTNLMAVKWIDKREVNILSTFHKKEMTIVKTRRGDKLKPTAVAMYTKNMGAVDVADQMLTSYTVERKRRKIWYKKHFCHIVNQIVLNAYIMFQKDNPSDHLEFRVKLVERLLETHHNPDRLPKKVDQ